MIVLYERLVKIKHLNDAITNAKAFNVSVTHFKSEEVCENNHGRFILSFSFKLILWLMKPEGSMPHSQGFSNNSYFVPNQSNSSY